MNNADTVQFEAFMGEGVELQRQGDHIAARDMRTDAYLLTDEGTAEEGRAARDLAASYELLNDSDSAIMFAGIALRTHKKLAENGEYGTLREHGASEMAIGSLLARKAVSLELSSGEAPQYPGDAVTASEHFENAHELLSRRDQYRANMVGRRAITEALYGRPLLALGLSAQAVAYGAVSESKILTYTNPNLPLKGKMLAKTRGVARGLVGFVTTALSPFENVKKVRDFTLKLGNKGL